MTYQPELLTNEPIIRLGEFITVLMTMAFWEILAVRLVFPFATVGAALIASERGWGLLNLVTLPAWLSVLLAILALDLAIYFQHRLFHEAGPDADSAFYHATE